MEKKNPKVECVDAKGSVQFGCGGRQKMSVFVNTDKTKNKCKSNSQWILSAQTKAKTKSCKTSIKYPTPTQGVLLLYTYPTGKGPSNDDECRNWCEVNVDCGCSALRGEACYLIQKGHCAEVTTAQTTAKVCNSFPPVFEFTGCYSGSLKFVGEAKTGKTTMENCKIFCKDTCYMAIKNQQECFCFDSFNSLEASKVEDKKCGEWHRQLQSCSVKSGCGGQSKYSVYVNNLGGGKCVGGSPSSRLCDSSKAKNFGGYSYKIMKSVKSISTCAEKCRGESKCGCFSFVPESPSSNKGGCSLKPRGLVCENDANKVTATNKDKYGAGKCVQYGMKLMEGGTRKVAAFDFQMVGCYPEKEGSQKKLFDGDAETVYGLEACKMLCRDKCYMGFHGKNECFCSDKPKWTGGTHGSAILKSSCSGCGGCDFQACSVKNGCGGGQATKKYFSVYSNVASGSKCQVVATSHPWPGAVVPPAKKSKTCGVVKGMDVTGDTNAEKNMNSLEECREECESGRESWRCQCYSYNSQTKKCKLMGSTAGTKFEGCSWKKLGSTVALTTISGKCDSAPVRFVMQGCFKDRTSVNRNLGKTFFHVNSKEECAKVCRFNCFMGIQGNSGDSKQCRCSDNPEWGPSKAESCTSTCNSGTGTCGGSYLDNIYLNSALENSPQCKSQKSNIKVQTSFVYIGCFEQTQTQSNFNVRNFQGKVADQQMIFQCFKICEDYCFAAMQWLRYCTCGNEPKYTGTSHEMKKQPDKQCNRHNTNNNNAKDAKRVGVCNTYGCGGAWRDAVYVNLKAVKAKKCNTNILNNVKLSDFMKERFESPVEK